MKSARSIYDWREGEALIQRSGEDIFVSGGRAFLIKNSLDVSKYLDRSVLGKENLEDGKVYRFGFESGSRGYEGFSFQREKSFLNKYKHFKKKYPISSLSDFFGKVNKVGFEASSKEVPLCFNLEEHCSGLYVKDKGGFLVSRKFDHYIQKVTLADRIIVSFPEVVNEAISFPSAVYMKGEDIVAVLAPLSLCFDKEGKPLKTIDWFRDVYGEKIE